MYTCFYGTKCMPVRTKSDGHCVVWASWWIINCHNSERDISFRKAAAHPLFFLCPCGACWLPPQRHASPRASLVIHPTRSHVSPHSSQGSILSLRSHIWGISTACSSHTTGTWKWPTTACTDTSKWSLTLILHCVQLMHILPEHCADFAWEIGYHRPIFQGTNLYMCNTSWFFLHFLVLLMIT